jgi:hypothetical protein
MRLGTQSKARATPFTNKNISKYNALMWRAGVARPAASAKSAETSRQDLPAINPGPVLAMTLADPLCDGLAAASVATEKSVLHQPLTSAPRVLLELFDGRQNRPGAGRFLPGARL